MRVIKYQEKLCCSYFPIIIALDTENPTQRFLNWSICRTVNTTITIKLLYKLYYILKQKQYIFAEFVPGEIEAY